jgi:hypothetical protein
VRRTRISERIRKLQELVPNMEKVTEPNSTLLGMECCVYFATTKSASY